MSTHKYFDKICCVVLALTVVITVLFANGESLGVQKASTVPGYEKNLFDKSRVHTIDIIIDDWDEFTANARNEEYFLCSVVIDGEAFKNVAIRGKGNTSLSSVTNNRYSYKIEFDHYDSTNNYYGLDKLALNNIIQDNTYMKDYLTYTMMNDMGVAAPLCSYAYITVNGEDWGLYLAVEGVEESFLQRNYGRNYGELYKPDSMSMGGGRGNGEKFDMNNFMQSTDPADENTQNKNNTSTTEPSTQAPEESAANKNEADSHPDKGSMPEGMTPPEDGANSFGGEMPDFSQMPEGMTPPEGGTKPFAGQMSEGFSDMFGNGKGGFGNSGSADVKLQYTDDNPDSYGNIFGNAKTDITDEDKARLTEALKKLRNGEDMENTVDIQAVIRYFAVHNFVVNADSYTGSMIHNYYLYEKDGKLQMIPWDYNLAFGTFMSKGSATSTINDPIDTPLSVNASGDRPMIDWIFKSEEYTELYHKIFGEFIEKYFDSGYFTQMFDSVKSMISPYVEKDPTKFCTYSEFEKGIAALKDFCLLRAESVKGQLEGTIGTTSATQKTEALVDASHISISDMGSMGMGGGKGGMNKPDSAPSKPQKNSADSNGSDNTENKKELNSFSPQKNNKFSNTSQSQADNGESGTPPENSGSEPQNPERKPSGNQQHPASSSTVISAASLSVITVSILLLIAGLIFASKFRRRK